MPPKTKATRKAPAKGRAVQKQSDVGGRPTKLTPELCSQLDTLIDGWNPLETVNYDSPQKNNGFKVIMEYLKLCTKDSLCHELGIHKTTMYEYEAGERDGHNPELSKRFSDSIKKWETKRNALHLKMRPFFSHAEPTWIFLSKNFNQFTDTVQVNKNETVNHTLNINKTVKVEINDANAGTILDILAECGAIPPPDRESEH